MIILPSLKIAKIIIISLKYLEAFNGIVFADKFCFCFRSKAELLTKNSLPLLLLLLTIIIIKKNLTLIF